MQCKAVPRCHGVMVVPLVVPWTEKGSWFEYLSRLISRTWNGGNCGQLGSHESPLPKQTNTRKTNIDIDKEASMMVIPNEDFTDVTLAIGDTYGDDGRGAHRGGGNGG